MRTSAKGDEINHAFDKRVTITLNTDGKLDVFKPARGEMAIEKTGERTYAVTVEAADFAIFTF